MNRQYIVKPYIILATALVVLLSHTVSGQSDNESGALSLNRNDTIRCSEMLTLIRTETDNAESGTALDMLRRLIAGCPALAEEMYIRGESIYRELFDRTGENEYIDSILMMLEQRSFYFNNRSSNDLHKADILFDLAGDEPDYLGLCYNILSEIAENSPDQMECSHFVRLATAAASLYAMDIIGSEETAHAFVTAIGTVDWRMENNPVSCQHAEDLGNMETFFRTSGLMSCESIGMLYSDKINRNFRDTAFVRKVYSMLQEAGCESSDLYYNVAVKMFANDGNASNAVRLAELNAARNNMDRAVAWFTEAYNRDTAGTVRSEVLLRVAMMELDRGKRQEARDRAEHAWQLNKKNAKALMLLAECYAGADLGNSFDNHAAYWVAADYLDAAVKADPSLRKEAEGKIKGYMQQFPTREDCFYRKILDEGVVYNVGGWINEITRVRFRK